MGRRKKGSVSRATELLWEGNRKLVTIPLLILAVGFFSLAASTYINTKSILIAPFRSELVSFDVFNKAGLKIGTVQSGDYFNPTDTHFPGVQVWASQPFLCDEHGTYRYNETENAKYALDPAGVMDFTVEGGKHMYLRKISLRVDLAMQTRSNFPSLNYDYYPITPLDNIAFAPSTWYGAIGFTSSLYSDNQGNHPIGVLMADVDYAARTSVNPLGSSYDDKTNPCFARSWISKNVGITISLENWKSTTTMMNNLATHYGNSEIKIVPTLNFKALENFVRYDYMRTINGKDFHIFTNTTHMAIYDASFVVGAPVVGKVSNYAPPQDFSIQIDKSSAVDGTGSDQPSSNDIPERPGVTQTTLTAYYKLNNVEDQYLPTKIVSPFTLKKNFTVPSNIDIDHFDTMPKSAQISFDQYLQPYTKVSWATYKGKACGYAHYYLNTAWEQYKIDQPEWTDKFAYKVSVEGVYSIDSIVFTLLILSEDNIEYVPTSGAPVEVTDIREYGITDFGVLNPNFNDAASTLILGGFNFSNWLNDMAWFIILIIVAAIGIPIAIAVVISQTKKRSGSTSTERPSSGGGSHWWQFGKSGGARS